MAQKTLSEGQKYKFPNQGKYKWLNRKCKEITISDFLPIRVIYDKNRDEFGQFVKGGIKPMFGRRHSELTRKRLSFTKIGEKNPMYGKIPSKTVFKKGHITWNKNKTGIFSEETLDKIRKARSEQIFPYRDSKPERMMQIALALNGIKFKKHKTFKLSKSWHQVDIFIEPNICVEIDGIYFHLQNKRMKRDLFVNQELNILGYHVIRIRDKDILKNTQECAKTIISLIKQISQSPDLKRML